MLTVDLNQEVRLDIDEEMSMYCVTCGHEIHTRTAVKHMEKCFNKVCILNFGLVNNYIYIYIFNYCFK